MVNQVNAILSQASKMCDNSSLMVLHSLITVKLVSPTFMKFVVVVSLKISKLYYSVYGGLFIVCFSQNSRLASNIASPKLSPHFKLDEVFLNHHNIGSGVLKKHLKANEIERTHMDVAQLVRFSNWFSPNSLNALSI